MLLFLFTCQPTKSFNFSRSGVNVRAHILRKNYSRNFSSIQSAPLSSVVQLFCTIKAYLRCFTQFTVDQSSLTVKGSVISDTPNVRYLVAL